MGASLERCASVHHSTIRKFYRLGGVLFLSVDELYKVDKDFFYSKDNLWNVFLVSLCNFDQFYSIAFLVSFDPNWKNNYKNS